MPKETAENTDFERGKVENASFPPESSFLESEAR